MWHPKQNSMILPSQVTGPPLGPPKACMEDAELLPSSSSSEKDLLAEPSRKRKTVDMDHQSNNASNDVSKLVLDSNFLVQPHRQLKVSASLGNNLPDDALEMFSNHGSQTAEPGKEVVQFGCNQCHSPNIMPWNVEISERSSSNTISDMCNSRLNAESYCLVPEVPLALINSPAGKIPALPDPQTLEPKMFSTFEALNFPSLPVPNNMERAQSDFDLMGSMHLGDINRVIKSNSSLQLQEKPSEVLCSFDILRVKNEGSHQTDLSGGKFIQEVHENICSSDVKQSKSVVDTKTALDASSAKMGSGIPKDIGDKASNLSCKKSNDDLIARSPENGVGAKMEGRKPSNSGLDIQNTVKTKEQNIETTNNSMGEDISPKIANNPAQISVEHCHGNHSQHASSDSDGKCKSSAGNVAPTVAEKLWDGSLQLNASIKLLAVAFFKSGEKAPGIYWPQSIEVKGKVRLEAFEKFIQELPRSRSRGLMVTSLCWKVGTSEAGLVGMKQVAKSYKDGERVGFAQLCPGIDLYVCPRSDTIITILAKYGFFKGMAAIEDDKDSLIGCVVWRRHRSSLDLVPKKHERKNLPLSEQYLNSHLDTNTITRLNADTNTQTARVDDSSVTKGSQIGSMAPESAKHKGFEGNNVQSTEALIDVSNAAVNTKLVPSVPDGSPAGSCVRQTDAHSNSNNLKRCMQLEANTAPMDNSEQGKTAASQGLLGSLLIQSHKLLKQNKPMPEDDDLPEFDFRTACGDSHSPLSKSVSLNNAHALATALLGMKPSMPHIVRQATVASLSKSEIPSFSNLLNTSQGMPSQNKLGEDEHTRMVLPFSGAKPISTHSELSSHPSVCKPASNSLLRLKNLWDDDDDDMPEWCPPDFGQRDQLPAVSTFRPLIPIAPSFLPNLTSEKRPHPPPIRTQTHGFPHGKQH